MTRSAIVSCIIHLMIITATINLPKKPMLKMEKLGKIEVRMSSHMPGPSTEAKKGSSSLEDDSETRAESQVKKPLEKQNEVKELEKVETLERSEKIVKKTVEPEKVEVREEIKYEKDRKETTKSLEKEKQEKITEASQLEEEDLQDKNKKEENQEASEKLAVATETSDTKSTGDRDTQRGVESSDLGDDLIRLSDGSVAVKHQGIKGLSYGFVSNPEPTYPSRARRLGFKGDMTVRVIMQFDSNGRLEEMKFVDEEDSFGFTGEVKKAIQNWRLSPITYSGRSVKMRFYKSFKFRKQG